MTIYAITTLIPSLPVDTGADSLEDQEKKFEIVTI